MDNYSNGCGVARCACSQSRCILAALLLLTSFSSSAELNIKYSYIDGVKVAEFGDFGKAPNQYPTSVGDLNIISSIIVIQYNGKTSVSNIPEPESKQEIND